MDIYIVREHHAPVGALRQFNGESHKDGNRHVREHHAGIRSGPGISVTPSDRSPPDHAGRVYGTGPIGAELHIRPGPAIGGSAESRGNVSVFNTGEILPCADRGSLHMG